MWRVNIIHIMSWIECYVLPVVIPSPLCQYSLFLSRLTYWLYGVRHHKLLSELECSMSWRPYFEDDMEKLIYLLLSRMSTNARQLSSTDSTL